MAGLGAPGPHGAAALGAAQRLTRDAQWPAVGGGRSEPRRGNPCEKPWKMGISPAKMVISA